MTNAICVKCGVTLLEPGVDRFSSCRKADGFKKNWKHVWVEVDATVRHALTKSASALSELASAAIAAAPPKAKKAKR